MIKRMVSNGYVISPNNIHGLPGVLMYPAGQGIWTVQDHQEIQVLPDRIRVFSQHLFGEAYSRRSYFDTVTEAVFDNCSEFFTWCERHGKLSDPALPSYAQGMD